MYTPYSLRHNITDPDLAGLLDFLEREMGWEIKLEVFDEDIEEDSEWNESIIPLEYLITNENDLCIYIHNDLWRSTFQNIASIWYGFYYWDEDSNQSIQQDIVEMTEDLFFATYKTLLPEIRNLYSK